VAALHASTGFSVNGVSAFLALGFLNTIAYLLKRLSDERF
jgi:hypothetical protein